MKKKSKKKTANQTESPSFSSISDPSNLSSLLLSSSTSQSTLSKKANSPPVVLYIGPIQISNDPKKVRHGRGLIASRDIAAGECLFVTPPTLAVPVAHVKSEWTKRQQQQQQHDKDSPAETSKLPTTVDEVAEDLLIKSMSETIEAAQTSPRAAGVAHSFLSLLGPSATVKRKKDTQSATDQPDKGTKDGEYGGGEDDDDDLSLMDQLVGKRRQLLPGTGGAPAGGGIPDEESKTAFLRHILRRNAFGPDFWTGALIEQRWMAEGYHDPASSSQPPDQRQQNQSPRLDPCFFHILGLYPLAAMMNHSCVPNALRVFCQPSSRTTSYENGAIMVAHASTDIAAGEEIVWSYLPVTLPYGHRREALQTKHGFVCTCERCQTESEFWDDQKSSSSATVRNYLSTLEPWNQSQLPFNLSNPSSRQQLDLIQAFQDCEAHVWGPTSPLPSPMKRYLRMGWTHATIHYLNAALLQHHHHHHHHNPRLENKQANNDASVVDLLNVAAQLHFCFCVCDNASTIHLSVRDFLCTEQRTYERLCHPSFSPLISDVALFSLFLPF